MEMIELVAFAVLIAVIVCGITIKRYTSRAVKDFDGMGLVTTKKEASGIVAKF